MYSLIFCVFIVAAALLLVGVRCSMSDSAHSAEVRSLKRRIDELGGELSGERGAATPKAVFAELKSEGYEPEVVDGDGMSIILNGEKVAVWANSIPFILIESCFKLDPKTTDFGLLEKIAGEITSNQTIGRVYLDSEENMLVFRVSILAGNCGSLPTGLQKGLSVLQHMRKKFDSEYDAYARMYREQNLISEMQSMRDSASLVPNKRRIVS